MVYYDACCGKSRQYQYDQYRTTFYVTEEKKTLFLRAKRAKKVRFYLYHKKSFLR